MRSIWKGVISFGLLSIPVRLYPATQERDVTFHQVRRSDGSRVRYRRVAAADGAEVPYAEVAKGYELPGGEMVVLTEEDFAGLPLSTSRAIDVLEFVPLEQIDPIYFAKSYYLEPDRTAVKPYALLRDALVQSGRVALVKIALRQREQLAAMRVRDGVFVLSTMLWPDEIRVPDFPFLEEDVEVRPQELAMASSLISALAADFDPTKYSDRYREALQAVIDAKVAGQQVVVPPEPEAAEPTADLMAALRASIEAARAGRGQAGGPDGGRGRKTAGKADEQPAAGARAGAGEVEGSGRGTARTSHGRSRSSGGPAADRAADRAAGDRGAGPDDARGERAGAERKTRQPSRRSA